MKTTTRTEPGNVVFDLDLRRPAHGFAEALPSDYIPSMEIQEGMKFGEYTVLEFAGKNSNYMKFWSCRCSCGTTRDVRETDLRHGRARMCRSCAGSASGKKSAKHNQSNTPTYRTWSHMKERCEKRPEYAHVEVCDRWMDFRNFLEDMGEKPSPDHSIDRIDGTRGYEPGNCRWATSSEQNRNLSSNALVTWQGQTLETHGKRVKCSSEGNF